MTRMTRSRTAALLGLVAAAAPALAAPPPAGADVRFVPEEATIPVLLQRLVVVDSHL
jgi:hypothetical protein